jgi:hypothetical protein
VGLEGLRELEMPTLDYLLGAVFLGLIGAGLLAGGVYSTVFVRDHDFGYVVVVNRFIGTVTVCPVNSVCHPAR